MCATWRFWTETSWSPRRTAGSSSTAQTRTRCVLTRQRHKGGIAVSQSGAHSPCAQLGGYKQLEKFEIKREIESLQLLAPSALSSSSHNNPTGPSSSSSRLAVRCASGEFFHVTTLSEQQKKRTVQTWRVPAIPVAPGAGVDDQATFIVDGVRSLHGAGGVSEPQIAVASLSGTLSLFNAAHELQWSVKVRPASIASRCTYSD